MPNSIANADRRFLEPRTEEELLEREDRLALEGLRDSARALGEDIVGVIDLRRQVRRHPLAVLITGLCGGFFLARPMISLIGPADVRTALTSLTRLAVRFASLGMVGNVWNALVSDARKPHGPF